MFEATEWKGSTVRGSRFFYFISQGFKYFKTNKYISLAAIGVLAACLFIVGNFWMIYLNVDINLRRLEEENQTVLFLDDSVEEEVFPEIEKQIVAIENVDTCVFVSKEEAFADYREAYAEEYEIYSELTESGINPLRNSFAVTMKDITLYQETVYQLSKIEGVARIRKQNQTTLDGIMTVAKTIYFVCYWIMGLLLVASLYIIMNTIKIARFTNQRQINIMKFVGATDWFIRWPFIVEGCIIGLLAALLAYLFVWYTYVNVMVKLGGTIAVLELQPFEQVSRQMLLMMCSCGLLVGVVGSAFSIRRYFDV